MADREQLEILSQGIYFWNEWRNKNPSITIDLSGISFEQQTNLTHANLSYADLSNSSLTRIDLKGTLFNFAKLINSDLSFSDLSSAFCLNTDFSRSNLKGINFSGTRFHRTNFCSANLSWANTMGADLSGCNLENANLCKANLSGTNFNSADLSGAEILGANLNFTSLMYANLEKVNLSNADLSRIDKFGLLKTSLYKANLQGANLRKLDLSGLEFSGANLIEADLTGACLRRAILLGADLKLANLTGACIEDWNINQDTNLEEVECDYIFLGSTWKAPENKREYSDRVPSHRNFTKGEFTERFKARNNIIELVFDEQVNWNAFALTLKQLQDKYPEAEISVQGMSNLGGFLAVNIAVSVNAEQQKQIEGSFWGKYEKLYERVIDSKDNEITRLFSLVNDLREQLGEAQKLLAESRKVEMNVKELHGGAAGIVEQDQLNNASKKDLRNANISNMADTVQDNASQQTSQYIDNPSL